MKYVSDNKQRFEVIVVPPQLASMLLKLAHDDWVIMGLHVLI